MAISNLTLSFAPQGNHSWENPRVLFYMKPPINAQESTFLFNIQETARKIHVWQSNSPSFPISSNLTCSISDRQLAKYYGEALDATLQEMKESMRSFKTFQRQLENVSDEAAVRELIDNYLFSQNTTKSAREEIIKELGKLNYEGLRNYTKEAVEEAELMTSQFSYKRTVLRSIEEAPNSEKYPLCAFLRRFGKNENHTVAENLKRLLYVLDLQVGDGEEEPLISELKGQATPSVDRISFVLSLFGITWLLTLAGLLIAYASRLVSRKCSVGPSEISYQPVANPYYKS